MPFMQSVLNLPCRIETFSNNNVTVFPKNFGSIQFARQLAAIKNLQEDCKPFYVMDVGRINKLLDIWCDYLPRVQLFYAVDCNDDPVLLKVLSENPTVGFQCLTKQNIEKVLKFASSNRLLYSNACWTRSNIAQARANGIRRFNFDNERDFTRLSSNIPEAELILNVCINVNSEDTKAQMGCTLENAFELLQMASDSCVNIAGFSFNLGSACSDVLLYNDAIKHMSQLFNFAFQLGLTPNILSIGGGFSNQNVSSFSKIFKQINNSLEHYFPIDNFPHLQIIATPGRFIASSAFCLVTNVVGRRAVDASYITNDDFDIGTQGFIYETNEGYYGSFGCRINANCNPECSPLFDCFTSEHVYGSVLGPTLDENFDIVQSLCRFRPLCVGDWLIWNNMGAYSLNNYGHLNDLNDMETRPTSPSIFYFTSQNDWIRLHNYQNNINNKENNKKTINEDMENFKLIVCEEFDEGIGLCGVERSSSPSESTLSIDELDDEDFLIGLDNFFDV